MNALTVGAGAILQPIIGALLDLLWDGRLENGVRIYAADDYQTAFVTLTIWAGAGLLLSLALTETHCRQLETAGGNSSGPLKRDLLYMLHNLSENRFPSPG